ncbi:MAG: diversity-generating retroelement protein Avd [Veillonellaceae bacterium]|nr:diversity-generating retroelement protein Avd [Veillonellaceae bacterium]
MKDTTPFLILQKAEDLADYTETSLMHSNYEKHQRFQLCADIRSSVKQVMHLIIRAGKRYYKKTTLEDLDIELEYLRSLIRLSYRRAYISTHRLDTWMNCVNEVGAITGSWLQKLASKKKAK